MYCPYCGKRIKDDASFCGFCGKSIKGNPGKGTFPTGTPLKAIQKEQISVAKVPVEHSQKASATETQRQKASKTSRKKGGSALVVILLIMMLVLIVLVVSTIMLYTGNLEPSSVPIVGGKLETLFNAKDEPNDEADNKQVVETPENPLTEQPLETPPEVASEVSTTPEPDAVSEETVTPAPVAGPEVTTTPTPNASSEVATTPVPLAASAYTGSLQGWMESRFASAAASSEIHYNGMVYSASNAIDGKMDTSWQEDADDDGVGEYLIAFFDDVKSVQLLGFRLGYAPYYEPNGRPKTLKVSFSDGTELLCDFADVNETVYLKLNFPIETSFIRYTIMDVYPGSQYTDTCITELTAYY